MSVLNLEQLKASIGKSVQTRDVQVDELGGKVRIKKLGSAEGIELGGQLERMKRDEEGKLAPKQMADFYVLLLSRAIVDEKGTAYLNNNEGRKLLKQLSLTALMDVGGVACELSGFSKKAAEARLEAGKKPSTSSPSGRSPSDSA